MIIIGRRQIKREKAKRLLIPVGYNDEIDSFVDSLPDQKYYEDVQAFKWAFRNWKQLTVK